jgi:prephenate dehydratase
MKIAFSGVRGAFSELAAACYFNSSVRVLPLDHFAEAFAAVSDGKAHHAVIPIENSRTGSIHGNFDLLLAHDLFITGELYLKVSHCLIVHPGISRGKIKRVFSHPQALAQCQHYLARFPNLEVIPVSDTASSVKMIKEQGLHDAAGIASMQAAIDYDMHIVAKNIQDDTNNRTRFIVVSPKPRQRFSPRASVKTSIVFAAKNVPGALFKCLAVFALRDIDLYKIESRPAPGRGFEYLFYLDFAGSADKEAQQHALDHLGEITVFNRVLGSYPLGKEAHPAYGRRKLHN